ncbi:MAG TPA: ATP-binding protein [Polyangia bacterium]|nr:ATP-binding protein [Polyangia bacterium]
MSFRSKLLLALLPAAAALVAVGLVSSAVTAALGRQSGTILADNFRSVLAAERMKEALERMDRATLHVLAGHEADAATEIATNRQTFERELRLQEANITERGEREVTVSLRSVWIDYQAALVRYLAASPRDRELDYFQRVGPACNRARNAADEILAINEAAMTGKSTAAERRALRFERLMIAAIGLASLLGLVASATLTARLLRPLRVVATAVRRFGQGEVQARAQVTGNDEAAELAQEFNTMADRLERYRASSLGELLLAQQMAQAAIDGLPDPVVMLDAEGRSLGANQAALTVLKVDTDRADPFAGVEPQVSALLARVRSHVASGAGPYVPGKVFEEALRTAGPGGERVYLPRGMPLRGEAGNVVGTAVVLQDVTALFRFDELKSNLVATVAHEFRTPLTSLRMALHLCTDQVVGPLTGKQAELLGAAREDCERLQRIVDDLLDLSRIESGRIDLNRRRIAPQTLIDLAIDVHRATAESHGVTLRSETLPGTGEVFADPDRLQLVFSNLLSNAIRYSPRGSEIVVSAGPETGEVAGPPDHQTKAERWVRFEVRDEGPGIPREHQGGLFEKFFRVPGAEQQGGSGLGLFIARGIVQAHGGRIALESEPGRGATFRFTIPGADEGAAGPRGREQRE